MLYTMLRAKIHGATITDLQLYYEGSITIDRELIEKVGIKPYEKVQVLNLNNGSRIETYVIPGKKGEICLNGPAARTGMLGDKLIIIAYSTITEEELKDFEIKAIYLDENNRIKEEKKWKVL